MTPPEADADAVVARKLLYAALGYWSVHVAWPPGDPDGKRELLECRATLIPACRRMLDLLGSE
jgi:hypothetical protein